jgi:outer membrane receptor for ferrienterochelin and colicins
MIASRGRDRGLQTSGKLTVPLFEGHALAVGWEGAYDRRSDERRERDYLDPAASHPRRRRALQRPGGAAGGVCAGRVGDHAAPVGLPRRPLGRGAHPRRRKQLRQRAFAVGRLQPGAAALYKLPGTKEDQLRLAISRTYKAPGMDSLLPHRYISVNNSPAEPDTEGNPNLKPELALGIDAAWEHHWAEGAMLSLSASTRRIDDYARSLVLFNGSRWISLPSNVGKARTHSLQLETGFPLPALMDGAPPLELHANVARNWSSVDGVPGPDNRLDEQVPLSANSASITRANG